MTLVPSRLLPATLAICLLLTAAACGGDDDAGSSDPASSGPVAEAPNGSQDDTAQAPAAEPETSADEDGAVCDLLTDDEIAAAVGFAVVDKTANTMALPTCEWELDTSSVETANMPVFSMVLLPEDQYQFRADQSRERMTAVDGVGDEALMAFADIQDGMNMVQFLALDGDHGVHLLPGVNEWDDPAAAEAALGELATLVFERL